MIRPTRDGNNTFLQPYRLNVSQQLTCGETGVIRVPMKALGSYSKVYLEGAVRGSRFTTTTPIDVSIVGVPSRGQVDSTTGQYSSKIPVIASGEVSSLGLELTNTELINNAELVLQLSSEGKPLQSLCGAGAEVSTVGLSTYNRLGRAEAFGTFTESVGRPSGVCGYNLTRKATQALAVVNVNEVVLVNDTSTGTFTAPPQPVPPGGAVFRKNGIVAVAAQAGNPRYVVITSVSNGAISSVNGDSFPVGNLVNLGASGAAITVNPATGLYVVTGQNMAASSTDALTYTARSIAAGYWSALAYSAALNRYVALNNSQLAPATGGTVAYSNDGVNWSSNPGGISNRFWTNIAVNATGRFVSCCPNTSVAAYSNDGITWTDVALPSSQDWRRVTCVQQTGLFIAVASNTNISALSNDGITWTAGTLPATQNWDCCCASPKTGIIVILARFQTGGYYSFTGTSWTFFTLTGSPTNYIWTAMSCGGDGVFTVFTTDGFSHKSADGISWPTIFSAPTYNWLSSVGRYPVVNAVSAVAPGVLSQVAISQTNPADTQYYAVDEVRHCVNLFSLGGTNTVVSGTQDTPGTAIGLYNAPKGICAFNRPGLTETLFVADTANSRITKFAALTPGTSSLLITTLGAERPRCVCVDKLGDIYFTEERGVYKVASDGTNKRIVAGKIPLSLGAVITGFQDGPNALAQFNTAATGIAVNENFDVFVCNGASIRKITQPGGDATKGFTTTIAGPTTLAGQTTTGFVDGFGSSALFSSAEQLFADPSSGKVFIADTGNKTIRALVDNTQTVPPFIDFTLVFVP